MVKFKNIKIKKKGGGSRIQRVQVLASGKYKFAKNLTKSKSRSNPSKTKTTKKRTYMANKNKTYTKSKKIPLAPVGGFFGGLVFASPSPGWRSPYDAAQAGDMDGVARGIIGNVSGIVIHRDAPATLDIWGLINPFDFGTAPALKGLLWGTVAHKIAIALGANRHLGKIPFIGKYLSI